MQASSLSSVSARPILCLICDLVLISVVMGLSGNAIGLLLGSIFSDAKVATNVMPVKNPLEIDV